MPTTALALLEKPAKGIGKMKSGDKNLWLMKKRGWTDEQLAVRFGMKEPAVRAALDRYNLYRDGFANDEIDLELNKMATKLLPKIERVMVDGMAATIERSHTRGKAVIVKKVADHATRLKTLEVMKSFMETTRPKGGGITVNTQVNNNKDGTPIMAGNRGFDFEARLRQIRAKNGEVDAENIPDAEFEDEPKDELADELAEMGIELEDDEDEDEGDE